MSAKPARQPVEVRGELQHFPLTMFYCLAFDIGRGMHNFGRHELAIAMTQHEPRLDARTINDIKVAPFDADRPAAYPLVAKWVREKAKAHLAIEDVRLALPRRPSRWLVLFNTSAPGQPLIGFYDAWDEFEWGPLEEQWDAADTVRRARDHLKGEWLELSFGNTLTLNIPKKGDDDAGREEAR